MRQSGQDHELEKFFEMTPGFCNPDTAQASPGVSQDGRFSMQSALFEFLSRTFQSNSLSELDKSRRFVIGVKAVDAARLPLAVRLIILNAYSSLWYMILYSAEMTGSLKSKQRQKRPQRE